MLTMISDIQSRQPNQEHQCLNELEYDNPYNYVVDELLQRADSSLGSFLVTIPEYPYNLILWLATTQHNKHWPDQVPEITWLSSMHVSSIGDNGETIIMI